MVILTSSQEEIYVWEKLRGGKFLMTKRTIRVCKLILFLRFPRVAETAWMKMSIKRDSIKLSPLFKNIKDALISRIKTTDYIVKNVKKEAIEYIKNKKNIDFSLYDNALSELLESLEVRIFLVIYFQQHLFLYRCLI